MTNPEEQTNTTMNIPDLEKLGKERPQFFSGLWPELAFCFSIMMSQIMAVSRDSVPNKPNHLTYRFYRNSTYQGPTFFSQLL